MGSYQKDGCITRACVKVGKRPSWVTGFDAETCCDHGGNFFPVGQNMTVKDRNDKTVSLDCLENMDGPYIQPTVHISMDCQMVHCISKGKGQPKSVSSFITYN